MQSVSIHSRHSGFSGSFLRNSALAILCRYPVRSGQFQLTHHVPLSVPKGAPDVIKPPDLAFGQSIGAWVSATTRPDMRNGKAIRFCCCFQHLHSQPTQTIWLYGCQWYPAAVYNINNVLRGWAEKRAIDTASPVCGPVYQNLACRSECNELWCMHCDRVKGEVAEEERK
jgi:hypothetical protein